MNTHAHIEDPIVETAAGKLRGTAAGGIARFLGIPYGADTGGANRFRPPQPARPWSGVRDATALGRRAPQGERKIVPANAWIRDATPTGEDCLVLNVYAPAAEGGGRPVMVWLHGGGYFGGSGGAPGLDGGNLSAAGNLVVVTLNHRLNAFGYTFVSGLGDAGYPDAGNAGMLDIVQALEWVRDNIAGFGGDPGNVTIFGQSGGGSKVAVMMTMPAAKGLFHKAVIQSSSSHLRLATEEGATRSAAAIARALGIDGADGAALRKVAADDYLAAYHAAVEARNGNDSFRPVVDGRSILNHPFDLSAPDLAADVPLMVGSCETEKSFYDVTLDPKDYPLSEDQLVDRVAHHVGIDKQRAAALIAGYREDRPGIGERDLFNVIHSDHMYRRNNIRAAELKTRQGGAPAWLYEFTWKTPVLDGMLKSPHTLCIPFAFGNIEAAKDFVGEGPRQEALQDKVMNAWIAFARTGNPNHAGLPDWSPFELERRPTMIFDDECRVENDPKPADLARINACPEFVSDAQFPEAA